MSSIRNHPDHFLIVGGGKTGIDAVLYLLDHGLDPDKLMWIVPNDAWFFNRDRFEVGDVDVVRHTKDWILGMIEEETWEDAYLRYILILLKR